MNPPDTTQQVTGFTKDGETWFKVVGDNVMEKGKTYSFKKISKNTVKLIEVKPTKEPKT